MRVSYSWILYPDTNFLADTAEASIHYTGVDGPQSCMDLPSALEKNVGSYRPAGDPGGANCSLNLYVNRFYAATEELIISSANEVPYAFNSVIRAGDCEWEFFMKEGFDGFSECLQGPTTDEANIFVPDFTAKFGVQAGDIKSIRQGCSKPGSKLNPNHVRLN